MCSPDCVANLFITLLVGMQAHDIVLHNDRMSLQGPTNPLALKRTFGQPGTPRVKLYRDHAAWCPYCQKVWLQLEEKQISYTLEKINMRCYGDKPPEYTAKVHFNPLPGKPLTVRSLAILGASMRFHLLSFL